MRVAVKGEGVLPSFPQHLPPGWLCDSGDIRPWRNALGEEIALFDSGLVLGVPALYCSRACAKAAGEVGPLKAAPRSRVKSPPK